VLQDAHNCNTACQVSNACITLFDVARLCWATVLEKAAIQLSV